MNVIRKRIVLTAGLLAVAGTAAFIAFRKPNLPLETVPYVNLEKYAGKWFEIAAFPQRFQKGCHCTAAEYNLMPEGYIEVYNSCRKNSIAGPKKDITGKAFVADTKTNAKLKVQFFRPFKGDYWILELPVDYNYAVVGTPDRKYLWILSRQATMDNTLYAEIVNRMQQKLFEVSKLQRTDQSCR